MPSTKAAKEVEDNVVQMTPEEEAAAIKARIEELKANAIKNQNMETVRGLIAQLPKEKTASERNISIDEYAARVMSSQSPDYSVVPIMLAIAKTRNALKKQGYKLEDIENVIEKLEKAYAT